MVGVVVPAILSLVSLGVALECGNRKNECGGGDGWTCGGIFAGIAFGGFALMASIAAWNYSGLTCH